jgi:hypothetical protein
MSAIPDKQWCEDYRICKKIEKKKKKKKKKKFKIAKGFVTICFY